MIYVIESKLNLYNQEKNMLKTLQHKRFKTAPAGRPRKNDLLSFAGCYWCAMEERSIVSIGNVNDSSWQRPSYFFT